MDYSHKMLCEDIVFIAEKLKKRGSFDYILAIGRGGFIPAVHLYHILNISRIRTVQVESYEDNIQKRVKIIDPPVLPEGKYPIVVDDLVDNGETLLAIQSHYPSLKNAPFVVLVRKPWSKFEPTIFARESDAWITFYWEQSK